MYSPNLRSKSKKGSVQIRNSNGRLQLVFSHPIATPSGEIKAKRFFVSTGHEESPFGRQHAQVLAAKIQRDIDYGEFDASLTKYKPAAALTTVESIAAHPVAPPKPDLADLWEKYAEFKRPQVSQSTYAVDYRRYRNHIAELPTREIEAAIAIRDHWIATLTPDTAKRTLTNINACCNWALKSKLIDTNPFQGMAVDVQVPKGDAEEADINPFTREERDAIIQAFETNNRYRYYAPLVKFLFFTGCRPSEAIAL